MKPSGEADHLIVLEFAPLLYPELGMEVGKQVNIAPAMPTC